MTQNYFFKIVLFFLLTAPLILFAQNNVDSLNVIIKPVFNKKEIDKNTWFVTKNGDSIQFSKIKFYVTNFSVSYSKNKTFSIINSDFLIDVFNKETLNISLPKHLKKAIKEISFNIGVEEFKNTNGAFAGDLDPSNGMYWSWQSGYINFKIEGISPSCNTRKNKFQFHIGGFKAPFETIKKVVFKINTKQKSDIVLKLDLSPFFNGIDLKTTNQIMIPGQKAKDLSDNLSQLFSIE